MTYPKVSTHPDGPDSGASAVPSSPRFPEIEERVLAYWAADGTFQASIDQRDAGEHGENEFVFYDGPPFANGLPHYGHLLTGYVKDLIPRYQTMRGRRVERRFGWDTHGLPAELEAMRLNGIKTTDEIVEMGIDRFNDACRESVMTYTGEWRDYVTRQARWVDFDNDYRTMNPDYMESVMWAFSQLHEKGLVYEGFRVLPYCWNDETPLSNHELRMDDDVYQNRQDPAVTVGYALDATGDDEVLDGAHLLIWTTTPWTLTSNLAVMVGSEIEYVVVEAAVPGTDTTARYLLAEARLASYAKELGSTGAGDEPTVLGRYRGADLVGRTYTPPFSYFVGHANAFRVVAADDAVTTTDGTGLVHTAGAFGEVDKEVTDREGIEAVMPVGKDGRFTHPVDDYAGLQVFEANLQIIDHLKATTRGERAGAVTPGTILLRRETYDHSYPHCWRCREPLIYKGVSSWFVEVTAIKQRMLELNQQINWVPDHIQDGQFGRWLENARDWSITRNRFWGSPVPVWKSDDPAYPRLDVYGSFADIERDFGDLPRNHAGEPDLHRPFVDELVRPNPDDPRPEGERSMMRRVPDVLDVWFDSGSMSYAQVHYPFENAEWFAGPTARRQGRPLPGRLHRRVHRPDPRLVLHAAHPGDRALRQARLRELHQPRHRARLRRQQDEQVAAQLPRRARGLRPRRRRRDALVPDVEPDPARRQPRGHRAGHPRLGAPGADPAVEQLVLLPALRQRRLRRGADAPRPPATRLDRYLLAKCGQYVEQMTDRARRLRRRRGVRRDPLVPRRADQLVHPPLARAVLGRRRRGALRHPLHGARDGLPRHRAAAAAGHRGDLARPDRRALGAPGRLAAASSELPADDQLVAAMDQVREVCSATSALRKARSLRNRLPLSQLTVVVADPAALGGFEPIVADEVNVRSVRLLGADAPEAASYGVSQRLTVNARAAGPRLGKDVQHAIKGSKSGDWSVAEDGTVTAGGLALVEGEYTLETVAGSAESTDAIGMLPGGGFVVLDTVVTDGAGRRGPGPRPGARGPAGSPRRRPRGLRPDRADHRRLRDRAGRRVDAPRADHRRDPGDGLRGHLERATTRAHR